MKHPRKIFDYFPALVKDENAFRVRAVGHYLLFPSDRQPDKHAAFGEIFWCIDGNGIFEYGGRSHILRPGNFWYYPPDSDHIITPGEPFFHYRWLSIEGSGAGSLFEGLRIKAGAGRGGACPEQLFASVEINVQSMSYAHRLEALSSAFRILVAASGARHSGEGSNCAESAKLLIEENFSNPGLNVEQLAESLHVHRVSLGRIFKKNYGIGIGEYLRSLRIREGIRMLRESGLPGREIALRCGFSSPIYFTKTIRRATGYSPRRFRPVPDS